MLFYSVLLFHVLYVINNLLIFFFMGLLTLLPFKLELLYKVDITVNV